MAWLIMNDEIDFPAMWYPTHIVSKDKTLLHVYIGSAGSLLGGFGIWIRDEDYNKINHKKAYIFIHNPEAVDDDLDDINWDKVPNVKEKKLVNREHIHIWKDPEREGET